MGIYINPDDMTKEQWLAANAEEVTRLGVVHCDLDGDKLPVILMDNGPFTAAAVAFDAGEVKEFTDLSDYRRKSFYLVDRTKLIEVCGDIERLSK